MTPGVTVVGIEATAEIDRREFGVTFEGTLENGSLVVSHKITLEFAVEASLAS
jgi:polyisoprenoid-binding protein YceI